VQYRQAALLGAGIWRLSGLLRGQQGTEGEMEAGAPEGAIVVLLGPRAGSGSSMLPSRRCDCTRGRGVPP